MRLEGKSSASMECRAGREVFLVTGIITADKKTEKAPIRASFRQMLT